MGFRSLIAASLLVVAPIDAQAAVVDFTYTDTIGSTYISGVNVGDTATIHLYADNGGTTTLSQTFDTADMQGFTIDVGSFHGTYSTVFPSAIDPFITTDASGAVNLSKFSGTATTSVNSDSFYANFVGDYVTGDAIFYDPQNIANNLYLFQLAGKSFTELDNYTVAMKQSSNVPEPTNLSLLGMGLAGLGIFRRKAKKQYSPN